MMSGKKKSRDQMNAAEYQLARINIAILVLAPKSLHPSSRAKAVTRRPKHDTNIRIKHKGFWNPS